MERIRPPDLSKLACGLSPSSKSNNAGIAQAMKMATVLFSCWRRDGVDNPELYLKSAAGILADYPASCGEAVCNPTKGLPSRLQWLPSLAELKAALEQEDAPRRRALEREARYAETRKLLAAPEPEPDDVRERVAARARAVADELRGKLNPEAERAAAELRLSELYGKPLPQFSDALRARLAEPRE
jgi:hypothetical protein